MFERIIVASSDIFPDFKTIFASIVDLKKLGLKHCLLLQCQPTYEIDEVSLSYLSTQFEKALDAQKKYLEGEGLTVDSRIVYGMTRTEISRIAKEENCSLIVSAAAEHSLVGGFLYGGIAFEVIHSNQNPILIIRQPDTDVEAQPLPDLLSHILFATDFSDNALRAFDYLRKMAKKGIGKVSLYHVQDKSRIDPEKLGNLDSFNEKDRARLIEMRQTLLSEGVGKVEIQITLGSPTADILEFVKNNDVSMVIMGSQGRGFIKEVFLGSVSHNIARHAAASVMLIPAERKDG